MFKYQASRTRESRCASAVRLARSPPPRKIARQERRQRVFSHRERIPERKPAALDQRTDLVAEKKIARSNEAPISPSEGLRNGDARTTGCSIAIELFFTALNWASPSPLLSECASTRGGNI